MRSKQIFGVGTATANALSYVDIPEKTTIRAIQLSLVATSVTTLDYIYGEISLQGSAQTATNDSLGILLAFGSGATTSLAASPHINQTFPVNASVDRGTRLYLNVVESGTATWSIRAVVWYD